MIYVYQMTTRRASQIKGYQPKQSFFKKHEEVISQLIFAAIAAYLIIQFLLTNP